MLVRRMKDSFSRARLKAAVRKVKAEARRLGVDAREGQPTPGNIRAGITTLEEKSLAAIVKAGPNLLKAYWTMRRGLVTRGYSSWTHRGTTWNPQRAWLPAER